MRKKLSSRVTLLRRLVGSGWGAGVKTLRIATLSLVYSTAEYCAPVWCRSAHTRLIDSVLNDGLRIVTGCLHPTPTDHLPVLSGIQPAELRRMGATLSLAYRGSLDPDHIQIVKESVLRSPSRTGRKHSAALSLCVGSVRQILNSDLRFYLYMLMIAQELLEQDNETRVACCKDILKNDPANAILRNYQRQSSLLFIWFCQQEKFLLLVRSNLRELHERPLHSERVTMWCAVASFGV